MLIDSEKKSSKRIIQYDVIRAMAIICVVLCHSVEAVYSFTINEWLTQNTCYNIFMIVSFTIGRLAVPCFLFLTGALVLKKYIDSNTKSLVFYRKNFISLYLIYLMWIIIYQLFFIVTDNSKIVSIKNILAYIFLIISVPLPNMWYFSMILIMYALIPLLSNVIKILSNKLIKIILVFVFLYYLCFPMIILLISMFGIKINYIDKFNVPNIIYILYIIFGYYLAQKDVNNDNNKKKKLLIALILYFLTLVLIEIMSAFTNDIYKVWYNCPFIFISSACVFSLVSMIDFSKMNRKIKCFIVFVSKVSLHIFFVHIIFQYYIIKVLNILNLYNFVQVILLFIINLFLCIMSGYLLSKNKILSRYLLFIRE